VCTLFSIGMATGGPSEHPTSSSIDDLLECPICLQTYRDPKCLDCQHTFCHDCLVNYQAATARTFFTTNSIQCPSCRQTSNLLNNDVGTLPTNFIVRDIIERKFGSSYSPPERPVGYAQQIRDRLQQVKKDEDNGFDFEKYAKPALAALAGVLGGLLLAKGVKKFCSEEKKIIICMSFVFILYCLIKR